MILQDNVTIFKQITW